MPNLFFVRVIILTGEITPCKKYKNFGQNSKKYWKEIKIVWFSHWKNLIFTFKKFNF